MSSGHFCIFILLLSDAGTLLTTVKSATQLRGVGARVWTISFEMLETLSFGLAGYGVGLVIGLSERPVNEKRTACSFAGSGRPGHIVSEGENLCNALSNTLQFSNKIYDR